MVEVHPLPACEIRRLNNYWHTDAHHLMAPQSESKSIDDFLADYKHEPDTIAQFLSLLESPSVLCTPKQSSCEKHTLAAPSGTSHNPALSCMGLSQSCRRVHTRTYLSADEKEEQRRVRNREYQRKFRERQRLRQFQRPRKRSNM